MNDDTLTTALDRMATALEPPATANQLIDKRRGQLRRRHRVTTGLAAASVVAIVTTGGVVASNLGAADPAPDNVPATSDGPTPSTAVDAPDQAASDTQVEENDSPWHCRGESMTPSEIDAFQGKVLKETKLAMDIKDDKVRAYVVLADDDTAVYEINVRPLAGGDYEITSVVHCTD